MSEHKMDVQNQVDKTGYKYTQFARKAEMSTSTLYRALRGEPISRATAQRIVNALNEKFKTNYEVDHFNFNLNTD